MAYEVTHSNVYVEIPEMDAFLADLESLLKRHRLGLEVERNWDSYDKITLVSYGRGDKLDTIFDLEQSSAEIPWLAAARAKSEAIYQAEQERKRRAENQRLAEAKARKEAELQQDGVVLSDGLYRLVKAEDS